ncbi:MAG: choloylglycine hydrolase [Oscillospiraceae bacterium]|nr:choloylglycine hydrolase [Oscillospiraceae bacterium]
MCTAVSFLTKDHYFGRNLDLEYSYRETVTVTPRNYPFSFRSGITLNTHFAIIGMATVSDGYPLYYEATNEKGLSIAALNFPNQAVYHSKIDGKQNIAPYELIPWLLGQCETVEEAKPMLKKISLWNEPFSQKFPTSPLHWMICDQQQCLTLEPLADNLHISENPVGVLTNSPQFEYHMLHLSNYMNLTKHPPENRFSDKIDLKPYSLGLGAMGMPGDLSSSSRFIRAAFTKLNSRCGSSENESISQFFHILGSVAQQKGLVRVRKDLYEYTQYSSCCNTSRGIYYYTTYENNQISAVDLFRCRLDGVEVETFPLKTVQNIQIQN